jgi:hypothetical protein
MLSATPSKLRDGSWGARVAGAVKPGDTIQISAKSGKTWDAVVSRVVWTDGNVTLVATQSDRQGGRARRGSVRRDRYGREDCRKYGWDGVVGSSSYYTSGQYDEDS